MINIEPIKLSRGPRRDTALTGQGCFMNVIAYLNGESQITDESPCVDKSIRIVAIQLNDMADDDQRQKLLPFILRAMGTSTYDKEILERRKELSKPYMKLYNYIKKVKYKFRNLPTFEEIPVNQSFDYETLIDLQLKYINFNKQIKLLEDELFRVGLEFLDKACNPLTEPNKEIIRRAEELVSLNS